MGVFLLRDSHIRPRPPAAPAGCWEPLAERREQQRQRGVFKCPPGPSCLGAKWRSSCLFTVGGCKLAFGESSTAHSPAARLGRERGGDLQLRKTTRKASICHFLGGKDSEESCLSLLTDAGSCGEMVAHWFASNSLFPSLMPPSSTQTQTHTTPFLLPSTACLSRRILFS